MATAGWTRSSMRLGETLKHLRPDDCADGLNWSKPAIAGHRHLTVLTDIIDLRLKAP